MARDPRGYGRTYHAGKTWLAHRLSYLLHNGTNPGALDVCHQCDNPPCCNPAHLFLGTRGENNADMFSKGRGHMPPDHRGDGHHLAKITSQDAVRIFRLKGKSTARPIAGLYGITPEAVYSIWNGKSWKRATSALRLVGA